MLVALDAEAMVEVRECLATYDRQPPRLEYILAEDCSDLAQTIAAAAPVVGSSGCIVHQANGLLGVPLRPLFDKLRDGLPDLVLLVHRGADGTERLSRETKRLLKISEIDPEHGALGMAGAWLFGEGAMRRVAGSMRAHGGEIDLTALAEQVAGASGELHISLVDAWHRYYGNALDLLELNRIALDRLETDLHKPSNNGNRIEGRVRIHEGASVHSSVIVGPTVIGPDACIADAYIGPYTSIGARVRIEGAEIERSIVCADASIMHVGGRLVASVVGREARVFRDFSLPRAMRLRVGDGTEIALC